MSLDNLVYNVRINYALPEQNNVFERNGKCFSEPMKTFCTMQSSVVSCYSVLNIDSAVVRHNREKLVEIAKHEISESMNNSNDLKIKFNEGYSVEEFPTTSTSVPAIKLTFEGESFNNLDFKIMDCTAYVIVRGDLAFVIVLLKNDTKMSQKKYQTQVQKVLKNFIIMRKLNAKIFINRNFKL